MTITDSQLHDTHGLHINDLRPRLRVVRNPPGYQISRRQRTKPVVSVTWHYNGPAVANVQNTEKVRQFVVTADCENHISRLGADSLQYHFVVYTNGDIDQTRDLNLIAWHCRNVTGNESSIAIHCPIGGIQDVTDSQLASLTKLTDILCV